MRRAPSAAVIHRPLTAPARIGPAGKEGVASDAFRVFVRVRPESDAERNGPFKKIISVLDEHVLVFDPNGDDEPAVQAAGARLRNPRVLQKKARDVKFAFDRVFDGEATQEDVFEHTTKPIIDGLLEGFNASVFAYGATGAGKTHTMLGSSSSRGVMLQTVEELYRRIAAEEERMSCEVAVSYLEVYNEKIRDLLCPGPDLAVRDDANQGVCVSGLSMHKPKGAQALLSLLETGNSNRTQHPTDANATSSRSHAVFCVYVKMRPKATGLSADVRTAKMSLIDLAGSERGTATTNRGDRMREGANINRSLLALGNCINALTESNGKVSHVPFRDSKLTRILKDSLGGNCRTVMIANISPSSMSYEDTYNTLKYANRAKDIKTAVTRNVVNVDFHVTRYKKLVEELQAEVAQLRGKLAEQENRAARLRPLDPEKVEEYVEEMEKLFGERTAITTDIIETENTAKAIEHRLQKKKREHARRAIFSAAAEVEMDEGRAEREAEHQQKMAELKERLAMNGKWSKAVSERCDDGTTETERTVFGLEYKTRALQVENVELRLRGEGLQKEARRLEKDNAAQHAALLSLLSAAADAVRDPSLSALSQQRLQAAVCSVSGAAIAASSPSSFSFTSTATLPTTSTAHAADDTPTLRGRGRRARTASMEAAMPSNTTAATTAVAAVPGTVTKARTSTPLRLLVGNYVGTDSPATPADAAAGAGLSHLSSSLTKHAMSLGGPLAQRNTDSESRASRKHAREEAAAPVEVEKNPKKRVRINAPEEEENATSPISDGPVVVRRSRSSQGLTASTLFKSEAKRVKMDPPVAMRTSRAASFSAPLRASMPVATGRAARGASKGWH